MNAENVVKIRKVSSAGKYAKLQLPIEWLQNTGYPSYVRVTLNGKTLLVEAEAV